MPEAMWKKPPESIHMAYPEPGGILQFGAYLGRCSLNR
jgi:hypothetical protein